jgi:hypothetical protein
MIGEPSMRRPGTLAEAAVAVKTDRPTLDNALAEFLDEFYTRESARAQMIAEDSRLPMRGEMLPVRDRRAPCAAVGAIGATTVSQAL